MPAVLSLMGFQLPRTVNLIELYYVSVFIIIIMQVIFLLIFTAIKRLLIIDTNYQIFLNVDGYATCPLES